jgi:hypothetical protein
METLSRARPKELAHDFLEREPGSEQGLVSSLVVNQWEKERTTESSHATTFHPASSDLEAKQQAAAERWVERQKNSPAPTHGATPAPSPGQRTPDLELKRERDYDRGGPEGDL